MCWKVGTGENQIELFSGKELGPNEVDHLPILVAVPVADNGTQARHAGAEP
jgi:hypothetical protein